MTFAEFTALITSVPDPVILIEGRRTITPEHAESASLLAAMLAHRFPILKFRSGNASGADEAFTAGVLKIAPERLQIIAPYASHRKKQRHPLAHYDSPESLSLEALENIQAITIAATPANKGLMKWYQRGGRLAAQAAYLIRDTMKVAGLSDQFSQPAAALFFVDPANPEAGGTGHTIRVCRTFGVPVVFQNHWSTWAEHITNS
ncbi:MAG: hypothetical protein Q7R22_000405 [Verrucomicrobiota bacterium JB025]|nr:hypothetical protein [Verrucomicrobiota bacterium JB025]